MEVVSTELINLKKEPVAKKIPAPKVLQDLDPFKLLITAKQIDSKHKTLDELMN